MKDINYLSINNNTLEYSVDGKLKLINLQEVVPETDYQVGDRTIGDIILRNLVNSDRTIRNIIPRDSVNSMDQNFLILWSRDFASFKEYFNIYKKMGIFKFKKLRKGIIDTFISVENRNLLVNIFLKDKSNLESYADDWTVDHFLILYGNEDDSQRILKKNMAT